MAILAISGWTIACCLAVCVWQLDQKLMASKDERPVKEFSDEPVVEADGLPEHRVMQITSDPRRARIMFERGEPGPNEHLYLYDGSGLRGQKHGA